MSGCAHDPMMVQALVDGELDAVHAAEIEARIATCEACGAEHARLLALREAFRQHAPPQPAPDRLRQRLAASLAQAETSAPQPSAPPRARRRTYPAWSGWGGGGLLVAACVGLLVIGGPMRSNQVLTEELIAGHVRSLQAAHLTDVATSDQHVVKPWFEGKLDFSPPVVELAEQGFPLIGGRLDYIGGRNVAAIVYRRGHHPINLFVWSGADQGGPAEVNPGDGYALLRWRQDGMTFWAVSDVNIADLRLFEADVKDKTPRVSR